MREFLSLLVTGIAVIFLMLCVGFIVQGTDFFLYKFFAPKYEQVRRETFEQSKAFRQGNVQEIQQLYLDYLKANDDQKKAIASVVTHRMADFDKSALSLDLNDWVSKLQRGEQ